MITKFISQTFKVGFWGLFLFLTGGDQLYMSVGKDLFCNAEVSNCTLAHSCVGRKKCNSQSFHQLN